MRPVSNGNGPKTTTMFYVEGEQVFSGLAKKVTISKKSTIFVLSLRNLVKLTTLRGNYFDQVS